MSKNTPEIYHQRMSTAFHTMIALPLALFVYLFLEKKHNNLAPIIEDSIVVYLVDYGFTLVALGFTYMAYSKFRKRLNAINRDDPLKQRFEIYSRLTTNAYLFIGVAFALLVLGLFLTTSAIFIVNYVILLFLLSLQRPTPDKYIKDLQLQGVEKKIVKDKQEFSD
ncbi:MAG: hypothetical protein AAF149_04815 [Bacteroidota bacterium]